MAGPFPFDEDGNTVTGEGPKLAQQGGRLRAVDFLKRSQTNRAAAIKTPINAPTWDHIAAVIRTFQGKGLSGNLATALEGPPVFGGGFAFRSCVGGESGEATAAALYQTTVLRVMATLAVRWQKAPRLGYFDDFGIIIAESAIRGALRAFAALNEILGFDLRAGESECDCVGET